MRRFLWSLSPRTPREATESVVENFLLHGFPAYVSRQSIGFRSTLWLGSINWCLFFVLSWTGILLMFHYIPSTEKAYISIMDIEHVVSFGTTLRAMHRISAHGMVALVFIHMMRVWYAGAYKSPAGSNGKRRANWLIGIFLLLLTLLFSFTGYLLPWDQLAYWAVVIGSRIVENVPFFGETLRGFLIGGNELGQNALLRFYVLHCAVLPLLFCIGGGYHMWRIKRDGGLAVVDNLRRKYRAEKQQKPAASKTYMLLGVKEETNLTVSADDLPDHAMTRSNQLLVSRLFLCFVLTHVVVLGLSFFFPSPLEDPANPFKLPNPAKAPWYFVWIQELAALTTLKIGTWVVNGGLVGGVIIPGLAIIVLSLWPFADKSTDRSIGVWFHRSRLFQNIVFTGCVLVIIGLVIVGVFLRGPFWDFYWFGQPWPQFPM